MRTARSRIAATGREDPLHLRGVGFVFSFALWTMVVGCGPALGAQLKPGEFEWHPERSENGPVLVIVSRDDQILYAYRNGIEIARSTISTGKKGHATPTGVFSILQKREEHYSNLYNNAPMPYMQRLTWTGIALHAGQLPGYPASHGCIRLPLEFSKKLYGITQSGMTVVITSRQSVPKVSSKPYEVLAQSRPADGRPRIDEGKPGSVFWEPDRQREGSLALIISGADREIHVLRNGVQIGRGPVGLPAGGAALPSAVFVMLDSFAEGDSPHVPGARRRAWALVSLEEGTMAEEMQLIGDHMRLPVDLSRSVYDQLQPGTLLVVTPEPLSPEKRSGADFVIAASDEK